MHNHNEKSASKIGRVNEPERDILIAMNVMPESQSCIKSMPQWSNLIYLEKFSCRKKLTQDN
jgi:hypothetical protein